VKPGCTSGVRTVWPGKLVVSSPASVPFPFTLAFQTAGDVGEALPFGLTIEALQRWTLIYLGLSSLVFVVVWVVGYLRR
jgi:hypothetical protein